MSDRILLSRLAVYGYHGLHEEEAKLGQRFFISLVCELDLGVAGRSDDYDQAVDYGVLADIAHRIATERRFRLIEALAEAIAAEVLARFAGVESVRVTVEKPEAPIPHMLAGVAVEIERRRGG